MEINIKNYESVLRSRGVKMGDSVIFVVSGRNITYTVQSNHLSSTTGCSWNQEIFDALGLNKRTVCRRIYCDESRTGIFPTWYTDAERDAMLCYLFETIKERERKTKEEQLQADSWASAKTVLDKPADKPAKKLIKKTEAQPEETISLRIPTINKFSIKL